MARSAVPNPSRLTACRDLAVGLGVPALAAAILPGPAAVLAGLRDPQADVVVGSALLGIAATLAWALTVWGAIVVVTALVGAVPNRSGRAAQLLLRRIAPAAVRHTAALAVGLSLTVGVALPAHGAPPTARTVSDATPPPAQVATPPAPSQTGEILTLDLDWGAPAPNTPAPPAEPPAAPATRTVTVEPGDCLWALAASELPPSATAAEIDAAWREWYRANREVIGADPNILIPGQRLVVPTTAASTAAPAPLPGGIR